MDHPINVNDGETSATPNERFEVLMRKAVPLDYQQELGDDDPRTILDRDLYKATKEGDFKKFIDALEEVIKSRKLALSLIFNQVTPSGNSLLHAAVSSENIDLMELILNHFPNIVAQKNSLEDTPLHLAIQNRRGIQTKRLIARRGDWEIIYWKNRGGKSPLYLVIEMCNAIEVLFLCGVGWDNFRLLVEEFARDEDYADKIQGMSPVLAAIERQCIGMLKEIIDRLPKLLHVRDEKGRTPLHVAASRGYTHVVELLLEKCPHLALQTEKDGYYTVHIACERWDDHLLMVNSEDDDGNTPLHLASMHNHCEVMRSLTKAEGINLRLRNNDGLTALDVAMESRSLSTKNPALVGRAILIVAGVPQSKGQDLLSPREQGSGASKSSPAKSIKDQVNTLLLVATLVASVTFTAGLTLPGGYNASGDPHPGTATMLHHRIFRVFIIADLFAMYSSILAVVVLLWGLNRDFYVAELAYHSAGPLLLMALTGMSVAFFAAITVAVSRLTWLGNLVMSVGVLYLAMVVVVLAALIFPSSKTTMFIVVFYYIAVYTVGRYVKFCVKVFYIIMSVVPAWLLISCFETVVRVCKRVFRSRESS